MLSNREDARQNASGQNAAVWQDGSEVDVMTRQILALFASSFLTVAMSIPAMARESDGVIESIDQERSELRLSDGEIYHLPADFDYDAVSQGMMVVVIYDSATEQSHLKAI